MQRRLGDRYERLQMITAADDANQWPKLAGNDDNEEPQFADEATVPG